MSERLERVHGDIPIRDATSDLLLPVSKKVWNRSVRMDPAHCLLAEAARDFFKSRSVSFFKTVAYVEHADKAGTRWLKRYQLPPVTVALVAAFDQDGEIPPDGATFVLKAPPKGNTLEQKRKRQRKQRATMSSYERIDEVARDYNDRYYPPSLAIRSGTGQWQVSPSGEKS